MPNLLRKSVTLAAALSLTTQPLAADTAYYFRNVTASPLGTAPGTPPSSPDNAGPPVKGTGDLAVFAAENARGRPGAGFALRATAQNPSGTLAWTSTGAPLPPGVGLNGATGTLTGVPTAVGTYSGILLTATDAAGSQGTTQPITVTVVAKPAVTVAAATSVAVGRAIAIAPAVSNAIGSQAWSLSAPLPLGLRLDATTGAISGSTDQAGTVSGLVLTVVDSDGASGSSAPFSISVTSRMTVSGVGATYTARVGKPFAGIRPLVAGTANPVTWALGAGTLPAGLSVDRGTGALTGTPQASAAAKGLTLRATDGTTGESVSSAPFALNVGTTPAVSLAKTAYTSRVGGDLSVAPQATGLAGNGYWVLDGGNLPPGLSLDANTGVVSGRPSGLAHVSGLTLRVIDLFDGASASSAPFSIDQIPRLGLEATQSLVSEAGQPISVPAPVAAGLMGTPTWSVSGTLPSGLAVDPASGAIAGTPEARTAAPATLSYGIADAWDGAAATGAPFTISVIEKGAFTVTGVSAAYTTYVGQAFSLVPRTLGAQGAVSWQAPALPAWASFDPATGAITGTPAAPSNDAGLTLTASDAANQSASSAPFSIAAVRPLTIAYAPGPLSTGLPYVLAPTVANASGDVRYALLGTLPPGLALDPATGVISGTTDAPQGVYPVRVSATDAATTATSDAFTLAVPPASWKASIPASPAGTPFEPFSVSATATGFTGPVTWSVGSGTLPAWASLSDTGVVAGTPTGNGYHGPITLRAADASGHAAQTNAFSIAITSAPALTAAASDAAATVNAPFRLVPMASNSRGALSWTLAAGTLPGWASLDEATGAIAGVPDAVGAFPGIVLQVADASGATARTGAIAIRAARSSLQIGPVAATVSTVLGETLFVRAPAVTGASGPVTWSVASGTLPGWASLNPDGSIGGTPSGAAAIATTPGIVLQAVDGSGSSQLTTPFSIQVARAPLSATAQQGVTGHPGIAMASAAPSVRNALGTVTWGVAPALPAGLSLDPATGKVSGTPVATQPATGYALTATDAYDGATAEARGFGITVPGSPAIAVAATYVGQINAPLAFRPTVTDSIGAVTWSLAAGTLPSGMRVDASTGAIVGTLTALGTTSGLRLAATDSQNVTGTSAAFSIQGVNGIAFGFTPTGANPPPQRVTLPFATPAPILSNAVGTVAYAVASGTVPPGLALDARTGIISGTPTQAFTGDVTLVVTDANGTTATSPALSFAITPNPSVSVADATVRVGARLSARPTIANAVPNDSNYLNVSVSGGLPGWASLNYDARTYAIEGTPTAPGTYPNLVMTVTDRHGTTGSSAPFSITVTPGLGVSGLAASYPGRAGVALSPTVQPVLANLKGTATWTSANLPGGLSLDRSTGAVTGTPSSGYNGPSTLTVVDSADGARLDVPVTFAIAQAVTVTGAADLATHAGIDAMTRAPGFTGLRGTAMAWSLASGTLPAWATLDADTGIVSVRNPPVGTVTGLSLKATDNLDGASGTSAQFGLTVLPPLAVSNVSTSYAAKVSVPFVTGAPSASNAIGAVTWSLGSGSLPAWATVAPSTGVISGTPDAVGTYANLTLQAKDASGTAASVAFTLTVDPTVAVSLATATPSGLLRVGDAYTLTPTATGLQGTPAWSLALSSGALPAGLSQTASTGVVSGTVTAPGAATFTISATDPANGASAASTPVTLTASPALTLSGVPDYAVRSLKPLNTKAPTLVGAVGTVAYAIDAPVPAGMNPLDATAGTLSGVPTGSSGPTTYTLTATDSWDGRTATQKFKLQVYGAFAWGTQPTGVAGTVGIALAGDPPVVANAMGTVKYALMSGGTDISASVGTTCPGLSFSTTTGGFTGKPTGPCSIASVTEVATDAGDNATATSTAFSVNVSYGAGTTAYTLPILDQATNWLANTPITVARLYDGQNIYQGQGQLPGSWCSGTSLCTVVMHWTEPKLWNVMRIGATSADQTDGMVVYYDSGDGVWRRLWSGRHDAFVAGSPSASNPDGAITVTFADTIITRVKIELNGYPGGWGHLDEFRFGNGSAPPLGTTAQALTVGYVSTPDNGRLRVGDTYTLTPTASGVQGTARWSMAIASGALPAGVTQNTSTGVVSGKATAAGAAAFTVGVTDNTNATASTGTVNLTAYGPLGVSGVPNYTVHALTAFNSKAPTVTNAGGAVTYALDKAVPAGMNPFDTAGGTLSGVPTTPAAATTYTLTATDAWDGKTATQQFNLQVVPALAWTTQPTNVSANSNAAYTGATPAVANKIGTLSYALKSGGDDISTSLATTCPGLSFSTVTGVVSGTPTALCSITGVTQVATDSADGSTATSASFAITVARQLAYAKLDPNKASSGLTISANQVGNPVNTAWRSVMTDIPATSGKAYMEYTTSGNDVLFGFSPALPTAAQANMTTVPGAVGFYSLDGGVYATTNPYPNGAHYGNLIGHRIMVAWDGVGRFWVGFDGAWKNGSPADGTGGFAYTPGTTVYPIISIYNQGATAQLYSDPATFTYTPPAGFKPVQQ